MHIAQAESPGHFLFADPAGQTLFPLSVRSSSLPGRYAISYVWLQQHVWWCCSVLPARCGTGTGFFLFIHFGKGSPADCRWVAIEDDLLISPQFVLNCNLQSYNIIVFGGCGSGHVDQRWPCSPPLVVFIFSCCSSLAAGMVFRFSFASVSASALILSCLPMKCFESLFLDFELGLEEGLRELREIRIFFLVNEYASFFDTD